MTHLPFVAGAYGLALLICGWFVIGARIRLASARKRLAAVDTRAR